MNHRDAGIDCKHKINESMSMVKLAFGMGLLSVAAFLIYLPSELGVALTLPPDSSEYSICLANLFEHGRFGFTLNGEWYPSRYSPFFSLLCLTPAYLFSGGNVLCLHWAVLAFALVLLVAVWKMGSVCGLGKLSVLPPALLMFMPDFIFYSRVVMTEIPYAALFAILAVVFIRFGMQSKLSIKICFCIGLLIAWSGLIRATGFTLVMPFALVVLCKRMEWKRMAAMLLALSCPIAMALAVGSAYNWAVFGSPFRNGYNYWQALPCDFPSLMFNLKHVVPVSLGYLELPIINVTLTFLLVSLLATFYVIYKKVSDRFMPFLLLGGYVIIHAVVLLVLYGCYYAVDSRFFLVITIGSVPLFIVAVSILLSECAFKVKKYLLLFVSGLCVPFVLMSNNAFFDIVATRSVALAEARFAAASLPRGGVVMKIGDPGVMDYFGFREKGLLLYPISRHFVYVTHMISPNRIVDCCQAPVIEVIRPPWSQVSAIIPECVEAGVSRLPFPSTFVEKPENVMAYMANGRRVFAVKGSYGNGDFAALKSGIEHMGLKMKKVEEWVIPMVPYNPVRHAYDKLIFHGKAMDERNENVVVCYEIVRL